MNFSQLLESSISPRLLSHWKSIEDTAHRSPSWHQSVHQSNVHVVCRLDQMGEFMYDNVFETLDGLPGEFGIQSDRARAMVAASPHGFHSPHEKALHLDTHTWLPS